MRRRGHRLVQGCAHAAARGARLPRSSHLRLPPASDPPRHSARTTNGRGARGELLAPLARLFPFLLRALTLLTRNPPGSIPAVRSSEPVSAAATQPEPAASEPVASSPAEPVAAAASQPQPAASDANL